MRGISNYDYDITKSIIEHDTRLYDSPPLYYDLTEFNRISVCLNNAYKRFLSECPTRYQYYTFDDYCRLHAQIWRLHASTVLRLHLENDELYLFEKYDNLEYLKYKSDNGETLPPGFSADDLKIVDPNKYPHTVKRTQMFEQSYFENQKHRAVSNSVAMQLNEEW